jgi:thiamine-monophosphate kinase
MSDSEFDLIQDFFAGLDQGASVRLGIGDDAAALSLPEGHLLHISTDTAVEGVHFLASLSPADVAYRSVMAAASDLAAMGASPQALLLALTVPEADRVWLEDFSRGLAEVSREIGVPLVGGDTTRGPLSLTVTVLGSTPADRYLTRSGAKVGDRLCVSGTLGDAAAGLAVLSGQLAVDESAAAFLTTRYTRPTARLVLGETLRDCATSCIDLSDGLLADAAHIASASGVGLEINSALLPLSEALRSSADLDQSLDWALAGGDDYELLFTLPDNMPLPDGCTEMGRVVGGSGISCDRTPERIGYDHFRR